MIISYFDCLLSNLTVKERYKKFLGKYNNYSDNTFVNTVNCTFSKRGHLSPKTSTIKGSNRHLTEAGLQPRERTCREMLFTPHRTSRTAEVSRSVNILYEVRFRGLQGVKFPNFHIFNLLFAYKMSKILRVRGLQPSSKIAECFHLFCVVAESPKRCLLLVRFSVACLRL